MDVYKKEEIPSLFYFINHISASWNHFLAMFIVVEQKTPFSRQEFSLTKKLYSVKMVSRDLIFSPLKCEMNLYSLFGKT